MRAERLDRVPNTYVIEIARFEVLEEYIKVRVLILTAVSRQEEDRVRPFDVLAAELECVCSRDPGYRVVVLERLFGISLLICRPKRNTEQVKVEDREIELRRITQLIEQRRTLD